MRKRDYCHLVKGWREGETWEANSAPPPKLVSPHPSSPLRHLLTWSHFVMFSWLLTQFSPCSLLPCFSLPTPKPPQSPPPPDENQLCFICHWQKGKVEPWLTVAALGAKSLCFSLHCGVESAPPPRPTPSHSSSSLRKLSTWLCSCMSHCLCSLHLAFSLLSISHCISSSGSSLSLLQIWIPDVCLNHHQPPPPHFDAAHRHIYLYLSFFKLLFLGFVLILLYSSTFSLLSLTSL